MFGNLESHSGIWFHVLGADDQPRRPGIGLPSHGRLPSQDAKITGDGGGLACRRGLGAGMLGANGLAFLALSEDDRAAI